MKSKTFKKLKTTSFILSALFFFWSWINILEWMFIVGAILLFSSVLFAGLESKEKDKERKINNGFVENILREIKLEKEKNKKEAEKLMKNLSKNKNG